MVDAAKHAHARIVDVVFHTFNPHGISGVIVIAESHLAIHTWPEYNFASIDVYTCGTEINPWRAYNFVAKKFKAKNMTAIGNETRHAAVAGAVVETQTFLIEMASSMVHGKRYAA